MSKIKHHSSWLNYAITIVFGVVFSLILLLFTWNNTISSKAREFELVSSSIKDTVARNVQTANDTLNSFSSFLEINPGISQQEFNTVTTSLLELHGFMEAVVYVSTQTGLQNESPAFSIQYQNLRDGNRTDLASELLNDQAYDNAINLLMENDSVVTLSSNFSMQGWKGFWILRQFKTNNINTNENLDFIAILINSNKLVGNIPGYAGLSILLLSDSASLSGRQLLFENQHVDENSWYASSFLEESITQFPFYSVKIALMKDVPWSEIDPSVFIIVLIIGSGVTLLLFALVKTKDEQERQLRERNEVIEAQVRTQTLELAEARDKALDASKMKSSFLASMSHEIRTPLNAIIGMSDLMAETNLDHEQKKYVSVFKKAGDTLLSLVNDILDLSKIEADQLQLEEIEFNFEDTIEESVEIYALKAAEKNLELVSFIDTSIDPMRIGDPSRLRQVVLNLISNALKFTDEGGIYVSVVKRNEHSQDELSISIKDTGTGIPENKLEAIFESFSQADSSTTRKYGGTGLGLTISRKLIEMMGGRIQVESQEGKGSCFSIELNLQAISEQGEDSHMNDLFANQNALVVDDNQYCCDAIATYVSSLGFSVTQYESGEKIDEYLSTIKDIGLIIVDADMPGKDGFEIVKGLQERDIAVPIVMLLNPSTLNKNQSKLKELCMSRMYVSKPVKKNELFNLIKDIKNVAQHETFQNSVQNVEEKIKPLKILLVEDNPDNRLLVKAYLKKLPYDLDEAENGEEALEYFIKDKYDLVLMDVQMPIMDGRVATKKIREYETQNSQTHTPIIALTAHAIKEEVDLCLEAGCDDHLSKPVKKSTLISSIQSITK